MPLRHTLLAMLLAVTASAADQPPDLSQMDPESIAFMQSRPPAPATPPTPAELKERYRRGRFTNQPDLPQVDRTREYLIPSPAGEIRTRLYRGAGTADRPILPVLVYFHGGGWMQGDLDTHEWHCRSIANAGQCAVLAIDYRTTPEHVFPAAYDDALAATRWVFENAALLKIDPARISVGGDSAGGNLAAAVALALRDEGRLHLHSQILLYPAVDLTMSGPYYGRFTKGVILTDDLMRTFIDAYIPNPAQRQDWRASPLLAPSLKGLPPTFLLIAGFDPLSAEDEAFATRLEKEGVPVTRKRFPGQMHGFLSNARLLPKALQAVEEIGKALRAE